MIFCAEQRTVGLFTISQNDTSRAIYRRSDIAGVAFIQDPSAAPKYSSPLSG